MAAYLDAVDVLDMLDDMDDDEDMQVISRVHNYYFKKQPFVDYNDKQFRATFRMSKDSFAALLDLLQPQLLAITASSGSGCPTPPAMKLMLALRFYAVGSFQAEHGENYGYSQSHVCDVIMQVSKIIASLAEDFIKLPSQEECLQVSHIKLQCKNNFNCHFLRQMHQCFKRIAGFPEVWGVIDCTHVPLIVRGVEKDKFVNRKGVKSLNVQVVVDANMKMVNLVAQWPGSVHDSLIFTSSAIYASLLHHRQDFPGFILGDAGYAASNFLLRPFAGGGLTGGKRKYQEKLVKTRAIIEKTFGAWKAKFWCLRFLRTGLAKSQAIIVATAVVWNFLIDRKDVMEEEIPEVLAIPNTEDNIAGPETSDGAQVRAALIAKYFPDTS